MSFKPVKYVLFDMDGLLLANLSVLGFCVKLYQGGEGNYNIEVDLRPSAPDFVLLRGALDGGLNTEAIYKSTFQEICSLYGKDYTDHIRVNVLGTVPRDSYAIIIEQCNLPISVDEFQKLAYSKLPEKMRNVCFMPGAERLVDHLVKHNVPIAIATSSEKELFEIKAKNHQEFFKKFHHIVVGSTDPEVKRGKPAPDIYRVCASRFPERPNVSECLVFEDAPNGIQAAIDAGMQAILVPEAIIPHEKRLLATKVISSLLHFAPEEFSLPPFDDN